MKKYRKVQTMDFDLYKKLIDEIAVENSSARVWEIFFGEPFLCRDMPKRIRYAKDKGLTDVVLNTNGVMMTEKKARAVIEAGLDAMYVGIDAFREATYRKIRIGGDLGAAYRNVIGYRDLLEKHGNGAQKLFVQFVVCEANEAELEDFKAFWREEGIAIKIRPRISWAGLVDAPNLKKDLTRTPCYWAMQTISICADGQVALCAVDVHCKVRCGDATIHSIKEIWAGALKYYRSMHKSGRSDNLPAMCGGCLDWQGAYAHFVSSEEGRKL